jgi:hypothetical protein
MKRDRHGKRKKKQDRKERICIWDEGIRNNSGE